LYRIFPRPSRFAFVAVGITRQKSNSAFPLSFKSSRKLPLEILADNIVQEKAGKFAGEATLIRF
jgi:hypothetical protein